MKRTTPLSMAFTAVLALAGFVTAFAATPTPNSAVVKTRIFNDCPTSTVSVTNNYPAAITINDADLDCFGFANLHNWSFSEDGVNQANFDNHSSFRYSATLVISGSGNGEAGLRLSPWYSKDVDGRFNVRTPDGEIACFGGRLPFYSFTGSHGLRYAAGEPIRLEVIYEPHGVKASAPGTIEYRVTYQGNYYTSGRLAFDEGNPAEDPPYGRWGILNDARVGGYFQPRLGNGVPVNVQASWTDIEFGTTPDPNSAVTNTRIFNDCPTSTVTVVNNYPSNISIHDEHVDCFGFANLHNWRFSEDGVNAVEFNNNARFGFSADLVISGTGNGEGGLLIAPWYSQNVDGRFNVRSTDGEIACFGGRLPFFSFTGAFGLRYVKGTSIHLDVKYYQHSQAASDPATIEYTLIYQGQSYTSGQLPFDMGNPTEEPPYGLWGMLNDGRAGGYFQVFLANGNDVSVKADWKNIRFTQCLDKVAVAADLAPSRVNRNGHGKYFTATLYPSASSGYTAHDIDVSTVRANGVPVAPGTTPKYVSGGEGVALKFDRSAVVATLGPGSKEPVLISGDIGANCFEALEFVNIREPKAQNPAPNSIVAVGQVVNVQWDVPTDVSISKVSMLQSVDGGTTWALVASNISNDGSHNWTVPATPSNEARISLVVLGQSDEYGLVAESEIAETGLFTIAAATAVGDAEDVSFAIRGVQPNPARGPLNVTFSLPSRQTTTLGVYDVSGRQVASRDLSELGAGRHTVTLGARAALRPGVYMVRLTQGNRSVSARAVVIE